MPAQDLSLPFPLALSEEHQGGRATPAVGYAEVSSSQVLAASHGTCSPDGSGAIQVPCHSCCLKQSGLSASVLPLVIKSSF